MAEKTLPPLPCGSFDLNAIAAAPDMQAEIDRQLGKGPAPKPAPKLTTETAAAKPAVTASDGDTDTPPAPKAGK